MSRYTKFIFPGIFLLLGLTGAAFGDSISVGYISNLSDSPTQGEQTLTISDLTGQGNCQATEYTACTALDFTNWTLTVDYTSDYGAYAPSPGSFVYTAATDGGDITPTSANNVFTFDLVRHQWLLEYRRSRYSDHQRRIFRPNQSAEYLPLRSECFRLQ